MSPHVTVTRRILPFHTLASEDFERMCLWLVKRLDFQDVQHLGDAGTEKGRDIVARKDEQPWVFQCKCVREFGFADAAGELEKISALCLSERPAVYAFMVACRVSANTRKRIRDECPAWLECKVWARSELDEMVKRHPDIVKEFFNASAPPSSAGAKRPPFPTPPLAVILLPVLLLITSLTLRSTGALGDAWLPVYEITVSFSALFVGLWLCFLVLGLGIVMLATDEQNGRAEETVTHGSASSVMSPVVKATIGTILLLSALAGSIVLVLIQAKFSG